jgi:hypothetical protein
MEQEIEAICRRAFDLPPRGGRRSTKPAMLARSAWNGIG